MIYKSKYKQIYEIKKERTWESQRDMIITKILPKLAKKINKKYTVAIEEIKQMLYTNWRSRNRLWRLKENGYEKQNKRRMKKNTAMKTVRL